MDPNPRKPNKKVQTYLLKLQHILPTFIGLALATIAGLMLFRWLFAIRFEIIDIWEEVWNFWLPLALPCIPVLIWLRPRLRILTFKNDNSDGRFYFQLLAIVTICICLIASQEYLTTATGRFQILSNITEIDRVEKARYYQITDFSVGLNLLMGLGSGVDNAAHIGGLLSGAVIGVVVYRLDKKHKLIE